MSKISSFKSSSALLDDRSVTCGLIYDKIEKKKKKSDNEQATNDALGWSYWGFKSLSSTWQQGRET